MTSKSWYMQMIDRQMPAATTGSIEYAFGMGGRVCDLPPKYLDAICEANTRTHPRTLDRRITELLVSGRFRPSSHPLVRGKTLMEIRDYQSELDRNHARTRRAKYGPRKRDG